MAFFIRFFLLFAMAAEHRIQFYLARVSDSSGLQTLEVDCLPILPESIRCTAKKRITPLPSPSKTLPSSGIDSLFERYFSALPKNKILPAPPGLKKENGPQVLSWEVLMDGQFYSDSIADFRQNLSKDSIKNLNEVLLLEFEIQKLLRESTK